jgi:hypothetical protein
MAVNHRKTTAKTNAPGSYDFYESPAQIGFAGVTTALQLKLTLRCSTHSVVRL